MNGVHEPLPQAIVDEFVGVSHGNVERVREMLGQYPGLVFGVARWGETPIEAAAQMANREIAEMLLAAGAPMDICTAASLGRSEDVIRMLEADPNLKDATGAHGIPLMHYPVVTGNRELAEALLAYGVDVNAGEGGNTALHGAAQFNRADMVEWLIEHGANINALDYEGKTALTRAVAQNNNEVAEVLRAHGATGD